MRQHVTDYLSDHNISFSAKQIMFWEALYELYRAPLRGSTSPHTPIAIFLV